MEPSRYLTAPLERLTLAERAQALLRAREAGRAAAERARGPQELEDAPAECFLAHVVDPALEAGHTTEPERSAWARATLAGDALRDPRVQAFFFGWHERATEILAQIAAGGEELSGPRARWFLDAIRDESEHEEP